MSIASGLTVAQYYARHAFEGRAVLDGSSASPRRWLTRANSNSGAIQYCLCFAWSPRFVMYAADTPVAALMYETEPGAQTHCTPPRKPLLRPREEEP